MKPPLLWIVLSASLLATTPFACCAQSSSTTANTPPEDMYGLKVQQIHPARIASPFPLDAKTASVPMLEFLTPVQMTLADRELVEASQAEILRRARLQGFELGSNAVEGTTWGFQQAACPALPGHLLLQYSRVNGPQDTSLLTVSIPRGSVGHIRLIPVRRRSFSLFTPAAANSLTIHDFNFIVSEEQAPISQDWLTLGLCYAALAGGQVQAGLMAATPADEQYPLFVPATLYLAHKGEALVRYVDVTPHQTAMDWDLTFNDQGKLLKVHRSVAARLVEKPVRGNVQEEKGVPTKDAQAQGAKPAS